MSSTTDDGEGALSERLQLADEIAAEASRLAMLASNMREAIAAHIALSNMEG